MPAQDGGGWLIRLCPYAPILILIVAALITLYSIYVLLRRRKQHLEGEEKILLLFFLLMLDLPVAALLGISTWFATLSIAAGVCSAVSFIFASTAALLKD